ncbi:MAG: hypothetical protein ABFS19_02930, partial [Thermodesulfobacteriota bacterium]
TQTLLPGAKEAYGQLPLQNFNLLEQQPITAYGHNTNLMPIGKNGIIPPTNFQKQCCVRRTFTFLAYYFTVTVS